MKKSRKHQHLSPKGLERVAQRFALLADPSRLALLQELLQGECSVGELAERVGQTQANVSRHLGLLSDDGLLQRRKQGVYCYYSVADPSVAELCELVCAGLARQLEAQQQAFR